MCIVVYMYLWMWMCMCMVLPLRSHWLTDVSLCSLPENWVVQYNAKSCCSSNISDNLGVVKDTVFGEEKYVLALTGRNADTGCSASAATCSKKVRGWTTWGCVRGPGVDDVLLRKEFVCCR